MSRSLFDQDTQVHKSGAYDDTIAPSLANWETNPTSLEDDLNALRSAISLHLDNQAGDWYTDLNIPATLDTGTKRGINDLNTDLHANERKRILRRRQVVGADIGPIAVNAQHVVLDAAGELPGNTTAAVGAVTTLGTIVAYEATFPAATLTEVAGGDALTPKNLCKIADSATGDIITDGSGREVHGLLQSESNTDGSTITITTPNRVQISFVVHNATNDDLELAAAGVMDGKTIDYSPVERYAFEDIPEHAWLSDTDFIDAGAGAVDRQDVYNNQGTVPVDLGTNATLDLEAAGIYWEVRDDLEARLFAIIEGSAGGTSEIQFAAAVDTFNNDAAVNDFAAGATIRSGGTRPITVGVTDGEITTTSGDLMVRAAAELLLDDVNQTGSTWAQDGIKLSDTTAEWDAFEAQFGEVSLLNAIVQAVGAVNRCKAVASVGGAAAADIPANTLIEGPGGPGTDNISADLCDYDALTFVSDVDIYINGALQWNGANAAANNDVYPSAVSAERQVGAFYCEYALKYRGGVDPDVITMIAWG